jgi:hypothetical protein
LPNSPYPRTDLSYSFYDGYAERCVAVQGGDADLELCDLTVEVPRHEPLAQKYCYADPRLAHASLFPRGFRGGIHSIAAKWPNRGISMRALPRFGQSYQRRWLLWLGILAEWHDRMGAAVGDCIVAFPAVVGAGSGDTAVCLTKSDIAKQIRQNRRITDGPLSNRPSRWVCVANRLPGCGQHETPLFPCRSRGGTCARHGVSRRFTWADATRLGPQP